jgi:thiamine pyrophosphokinase
MKTAYIFCKSFELNNLNKNKIEIEIEKRNIEKTSRNILYIAADSGLETAEYFNSAPDMIIGDLDSVNPELLQSYEAYKSENIIKYPAEKDDTDSMICVKYALEHGFKNIIIIGGTGGRTDHFLANLALLKYIKNRGGNGYITDGLNRVSYIANGCARVYKNYNYVSIIPVSPELHGVTLTGFLYNLNNASVKADEPYTVSNEIGIAEEYGEIKIAEGEAFICECD